MALCLSLLCVLVLHAFMYEHNFHEHLLGMKTRPRLSVADLSPRAISETQTDFHVLPEKKKVNFQKLAENERKKKLISQS